MKKPAPQKTPPQKLTTRLLETPQAARTIIRDTEVHGLLVEFGKPPFVSFKIQADLRRDGKVDTVRMKVGEFPAMSVAAARAEAMPLLAQIKKGVDPRKRRAPVEIDGVVPWTVAKAAEEYEKYLGTHGSPRSVEDQKKSYRYLFGPADPEYPASYKTTDRSEIVARSIAKAKGLPVPPLKRSSAAVPLEEDDWRSLTLISLTKEMVKARHRHITKLHGPVQANKVMRMLRSWINYASNSQSITYPANPIDAIDWNPETARNRSLRSNELPEWYGRLQTIYNPLRRIMHELALFTGARMTALARMEESWIDFDQAVLRIPPEVMKRMRKGTQAKEPFDMPLSSYMIRLLREAIDLKNKMLPTRTKYVFPSISSTGEVIPTASWVERKGLPKETGHILRHTYSNMAKNAGVGDVNKELLLGHVVPGIKGRYLDQPALFQTLLADQEKISNYMLGIIRPAIAAKYEARAERAPAEEEAASKLGTVVGLVNRQGIARLLGKTKSEVARMLELGMPVVDVFGDERFSFDDVLAWVKSQPTNQAAKEARPVSTAPALPTAGERPLRKAKSMVKRVLGV